MRVKRLYEYIHIVCVRESTTKSPSGETSRKSEITMSTTATFRSGPDEQDPGLRRARHSVGCPTIGMVATCLRAERSTTETVSSAVLAT